MRESHSVSPLLEGFDYFASFDQCGGKSCFKNQLRSHFHCAQGNNCPAILTQYSALATHKHGRGTPVIKSEEQERSFEEAKDYSLKERASVDSVSSMKEQNESYMPANFSIKSEFEREQDNVSGKLLSSTYNDALCCLFQVFSIKLITIHHLHFSSKSCGYVLPVVSSPK